MLLSVAVLLLGLGAPPARPADATGPAIPAPTIQDAGPFGAVVFGTGGDGIILPERTATGAPGQDKAEAKKPPTPPHTGIHALFKGLAGDVKHLPSEQNAIIAAVGGAGALAVHPEDRAFNVHLRSHYTLVNDIYSPAKWVGQTPVMFGSAIVVYALGRRNDQPKVSHLGMDLMRALIINEAMTDVIKVATRRERPDNSDALSFPSGHSSTTFAVATVIERHLGWKYSALGYTLAAYVASSRLHDNRHWLSDVVFGAAIGTISGRTVTQHGRSNWAVVPAGAPGGGVAVLAVRTGR
jgi:hypothetical protein